MQKFTENGKNILRLSAADIAQDSILDDPITRLKKRVERSRRNIDWLSRKQQDNASELSVDKKRSEDNLERVRRLTDILPKDVPATQEIDTVEGKYRQLATTDPLAAAAVKTFDDIKGTPQAKAAYLALERWDEKTLDALAKLPEGSSPSDKSTWAAYLEMMLEESDPSLSDVASIEKAKERHERRHVS